MPSDNSTDLGENQVSGLELHKDGHIHIYSPVLLYPGRNTEFISVDGFSYCHRILSVRNIYEYRYGII